MAAVAPFSRVSWLKWPVPDSARVALDTVPSRSDRPDRVSTLVPRFSVPPWESVKPPA